MRNKKSFYKHISAVSWVLIALIVLLLVIAIIGITMKYFDKETFGIFISFIGVILPLVTPDVYNAVQKESDERKNNYRNGVLINRVCWELKENEVRLKKISGDSNSLSLDVYNISGIECRMWETSNLDIELDPEENNDLYKVYAALRLLKDSYDKVTLSELEKVIEIILERMSRMISILSDKESN